MTIIKLLGLSSLFVTVVLYCVAKPAKVLLDMFPNLPEEALLSILQNYQGDFSAAVDEALTITSLGNSSDAGEVTKAYQFLPVRCRPTQEP